LHKQPQYAITNSTEKNKPKGENQTIENNKINHNSNTKDAT